MRKVFIAMRSKNMDTRKIVLFAVSIVVMMIMVGAAAGFSQTVALPPAEDQVLDRLNRSPRHGAWVVVDLCSGGPYGC